MASVTLGDGLKVAARVLGSTRTPMLAHLVVTRYCNLECAYCSEFDKVSKPVPMPDMLARIDALAALGTQIVTLTGGEPMTGAQASYIKTLSEEAGKAFDPALTNADALLRIDELQAKTGRGKG